MSIPTDVTYTAVNANFDLNPISDANYVIDLRASLRVNEAINAVKAQMLDQDWTLTGEYYASTTFSVPGLVGSASTGFSIPLASYYGKSLQFYIDGVEDDPTDNPGLLPGTFVYGMGVSDGASQGDLILKLVDTMNIFSLPDYFNETISIDTIRYRATKPGPQWNDKQWIPNLIGGYSWNGGTKGGGWRLTSFETIEHSPVTVSIRNKDGRNFFSIDAEINGNPCSEILLEKRNNYLSVVSPFMWCLFRRNDGTGYSSGSIDVQYNNYWICAPEMDFAQRNDPDDPLTFAVFVLIRDRDKLNNAVGVTAINGAFHEGTFSAFDSDVGISLILLNSMQNAAGALTTTADKYLQIQALIALSPDAGEALQVVGNLWDMYLVSKWFALDTLAFSNTGKLVIAYRSQKAPCEWTLFLALN